MPGPNLSLRAKLSLLISALMGICLIASLSIFWYTYSMDSMFTAVVERHLKAYKAVKDMQLALSNQKGFLTYYLVDADPRWLKELRQYRQVFAQKLAKTERLLKTEEERQVLRDIEAQYQDYIGMKEQVIQSYKETKESNLTTPSKLHLRQRSIFFDLLDKCERLKNLQWTRVQEIKTKTLRNADNLRFVASGAIVTFLGLSSLLLVLLFKNILNPIRELTHETGGDLLDDRKDEIRTLRSSMNSFLEDFDQTHSELSKSREHLEQAEKMAQVGKLAAGVAHTIRNPFTSVKMRLFSLENSLDLDETQKEDFEVISEEIWRIDNIVQNFLEFARPPKLKMEECQASDLVESVLQLLQHRLRSVGVEAIHRSNTSLPKLRADPEQLKEAFINLIVNACEAMENGGILEISEELIVRDGNKSVAIHIKDNGPGVPENVQEHLWQPFFSTKEEGTGLGLSIVSRIVEEHHGRIEVISHAEGGALFSLYLPVE